MPSPFPGMNPYLEQESVWHDFHNSFMIAARSALVTQVQPRYIVKTEEHIYLHELSAERHRFLGRADVSLTRSPGSASPVGAAVLADPVRVCLPGVDKEKEIYLEIRDRDLRQVVTVIELLSPANKRPGPDREQYLTKRLAILGSPANLIEIDLLRGGVRMPGTEVNSQPYGILISRAEQRPEAGLWPVQLPERLPVVPVPLRAPDGDVRLDLQAVLHRVYDEAGYQTYLYEAGPTPSLSPEEVEWAAAFRPPGGGSQNGPAATA
jgi:hypothetical protein